MMVVGDMPCSFVECEGFFKKRILFAGMPHHAQNLAATAENVRALMTSAGDGDDAITTRQRLKERRKAEVAKLYEQQLNKRVETDPAGRVIGNAHHQQYDVGAPVPLINNLVGGKYYEAKDHVTDIAKPEGLAFRYKRKNAVPTSQPTRPPHPAPPVTDTAVPQKHEPLNEVPSKRDASAHARSLESTACGKECAQPVAVPERAVRPGEGVRLGEGERLGEGVRLGEGAREDKCNISAGAGRTLNPRNPVAAAIGAFPTDDAHDYFGKKIKPKPAAQPIQQKDKPPMRSVGVEVCPEDAPKHTSKRVVPKVPASDPQHAQWVPSRTVQTCTDEDWMKLPKMGYVDPTTLKKLHIPKVTADVKKEEPTVGLSSARRFMNRPQDTRKFLF